MRPRTLTVVAAAVALVSVAAAPVHADDADEPTSDLQASDGDDQGGQVEWMSSFTVTQVPRSDLRDSEVDVDDTDLSEELRASLGVEETDGSDTVDLPGDVLFGFDEDRVVDRGRSLLADVAELVELDQPERIMISGHTDSVGSADYNQELSERRAESVTQVLIDEYDVDAGLIDTQGLGQDDPVAPNETDDGEDDPEGRALNRRVEITLD